MINLNYLKIKSISIIIIHITIWFEMLSYKAIKDITPEDQENEMVVAINDIMH